MFKLKENNTNIRTEVMAGITTFLAMSYILVVNPGLLSKTGMPFGGVVIATALAAFIGSVLMALFANYPFALAPGMGLNAFFTYTVVLTMGYSWQFALMAVFVEGLIFLLLSLVPVREKIFNSIPLPLKTAIGVGIGLFIAYIGLQGAKIVVDGPCLTGLCNFASDFSTSGICAVLAIIGLIITAVLAHYKIPGALLLGILITWGLGMLCQATGLYIINIEAGLYSLYPSINMHAFREAWAGFAEVFGACFDSASWTMRDTELVGFDLLKSVNFFIIMISFLFVDLFDTIGTLTGVASTANMLDNEGKLPRIKGAMLSDSVATSVGAFLGTSTTTTYVESAAGVAVGGRTGLTALVTAFLFLLSIVFAPIFTAIPAFATAPALIFVGFYMMAPVVRINFLDLAEAVPCYIAILAMPFTYSISEGICFGFISWTIINLACRKTKRVNLLMIILSLLFLAKYIYL